MHLWDWSSVAPMPLMMMPSSSRPHLSRWMFYLQAAYCREHWVSVSGHMPCNVIPTCLAAAQSFSTPSQACRQESKLLVHKHHFIWSFGYAQDQNTFICSAVRSLIVQLWLHRLERSHEHGYSTDAFIGAAGVYGWRDQLCRGLHHAAVLGEPAVKQVACPCGGCRRCTACMR